MWFFHTAADSLGAGEEINVRGREAELKFEGSSFSTRASKMTSMLGSRWRNSLPSVGVNLGWSNFSLSSCFLPFLWPKTSCLWFIEEQSTDRKKGLGPKDSVCVGRPELCHLQPGDQDAALKASFVETPLKELGRNSWARGPWTILREVSQRKQSSEEYNVKEKEEICL